MYGLTFSWDTSTQTVVLESGSPVYQNSVATHTLTLQTDLVEGNIITATFYNGTSPITTGLTMLKTPDVSEWTLPLPDLVVETAGTLTVYFGVLMPVISGGSTTYKVLTTGHQTFTVITSESQPLVETVTPTEALNLQSQIDDLNQTVSDQTDILTDLVLSIQPFIGENNDWYIYDQSTETMVDSGVLAIGEQGVGISTIEKTSTVGLVDTYTITFTDESTTTFQVTNGEQGEQGIQGTSFRPLGTYNSETTYVNNSTYIDVVVSDGTAYYSLQDNNLGNTPATSPTWWEVLAVKGADGQNLLIQITYVSIVAMEADFENQPEGTLALIATGDVEDPDNGKLYSRGATQWDYLTDLSGSQGVAGRGISTILKTSSTGLIDTYTITYTDTTESTYAVTNGATIYNGVISYADSTYTVPNIVGAKVGDVVISPSGDYLGYWGVISAIGETVSTLTNVINLKGAPGEGSGNFSLTNETVDNTKNYIVTSAVKSGTEYTAVLAELPTTDTPSLGGTSLLTAGGAYTALNSKTTIFTNATATITTTWKGYGEIATSNDLNGLEIRLNLTTPSAKTSGSVVTILGFTDNATDYITYQCDGTNFIITGYGIFAGISQTVSATSTAITEVKVSIGSGNYTVVTYDTTPDATNGGTFKVEMSTTAGTEPPFTQDVSVTGLTTNNNVHITPDYSAILATALLQKQAWNYVSTANVGTGKVTFYAFENKPTTAIPIDIEVM